MKEKIEIIKGEITKIKADAIFCQANTELETEDETSKIIIDAGGDNIQTACNELENLEKGSAALIKAGTLPVRYLIHVIINSVGEIAEEDQMMQALRHAFQLAKDKNLRRLVIPPIGESAGIPIKRAAELMLTEVKKHFDGETSIEKITMVVVDDVAYEAFDEALRQL